MAMTSGFMLYIKQDDIQKGVICSLYTHNVWNEDLTSRNIVLEYDIASDLSMRYLVFAITSNGYEWEILHVQDSQNDTVTAQITIPDTYLGSVKFGVKLYDTPPTVGSILHVGFDYVVNGGIDLISNDGTEKIQLTCNTEDADIRYTTDGNNPTESSQLYTGQFDVTAPVTIKARGYKDGMLASDIAELHIESPKLQTPTLSLTRSGTTVSGTIGNMVSGATYRYKVGSAPASETDGTLISGTSFSFTNSSAVTVYVVAFMTGCIPSDAVSDSVSAYVPTCATPSISQSGNTVTFRCSTSGATIHYSGCGKSGTCSSGGSVTISQSGTMTAYATRSGYNTSGTASRYCSYTAPQCATPSISFNSNTNTVSITCSTSGATIYYRRGSSGSYSVYSGSFTISATTTIYAYATRSGYSQSSTTSRTCTYTALKCATPVISVGGSILFPTITITCSTPGATIHCTWRRYTASGDDYTDHTVSGASPLVIDRASGAYVRAYATASGYEQSDTATYRTT